MILVRSYIVIIYVSRISKLKIGSLGVKIFPKGYYLYVGSGGRNVIKRLSRHFKIGKKARWHIDYLTNFYPAIDAYIVDSDEEKM